MDGNGVTGGEYREEVCTLQFAEFEEQHSGYWYCKAVERQTYIHILFCVKCREVRVDKTIDRGPTNEPFVESVGN